MTSTFSVYLVDAHEVVRRGIADLLSGSEFQVVGQAGTARQARSDIIGLCPNLAILDVRLPDGDGVSICREVRALHPEVRCLIFTDYDDEQTLVAAMLAGALGLLPKRASGEELLSALRHIAAGESLLDPSIGAHMFDRLGQHGAVTAHRANSLTEREREVLQLIAEGLTNRQIGQRLFLSEKTVKNHVTAVLGKLGLSSRTQAALYASRRLAG